jgi:hypothetical protein
MNDYEPRRADKSIGDFVTEANVYQLIQAGDYGTAGARTRPKGRIRAKATAKCVGLSTARRTMELSVAPVQMTVHDAERLLFEP